MEAMDSGPVGCGHSADPHGHPGPVPDQETTQINHALTGTATANDTETNYWGADKAIDGIVNRDETNKQNQSRWSTNGAKTSAMDGLTAGGAPETTDKPETSEKPETTDKPQATEKPENVPQTGDEAMVQIWVALALVSTAALALAVTKKKHNV